MKVILNVDAITRPLTGIGNYAYQLAQRLPHHGEIEDFKLYSSHNWIKNTEHILKANQKLAFVRNHTPFKLTALKMYIWQKNLWFKSRSKSLNQGYILHTPNFLLLPFDGPSVTTIHDLSFLRYPETHPKERVKILEKELPKTIEQADAIIAVSEYIKAEIQQILSVDEKKIHVVPQGVSSKYKPYAKNETERKLKKYNLDNINYLLTVATLEPRKNLNSLIDAYLLLPKKTRQKNKLVVVGANGWLSKSLAQRIKMLSTRGEIITLGYVDSQDLPYIYAGACGFALPSLYEGFGLPILEAMATGTPVLTSTSSSLPEVADGAAILVNALDIEDIANGLKKLIEDKQWQQKAIVKGLERAQQYTWNHCIDNTIKVYKHIKN